MFIKRLISRILWISNEYIARFFIIILNKKVEVKKLDHNFSNKRVMIISPHSDDECIGCFGIIHQSKISPHYWLLCGRDKNRVEEWQNAISKMSLSNEIKMLVSLEEDGMLSKSSERIYSELLNNLKKNQIDEVFCPSFYDAHPDHRVISTQVLKALAKGHLEKCFFYHTNYPVVFDNNLFKFELSKKVRKRKTQAFSVFMSQKNHLDFPILTRYQNFISWLVKSENCELFYKIDSAKDKKIISELLENTSGSTIMRPSVLHAKNSFLSFLRNL